MKKVLSAIMAAAITMGTVSAVPFNSTAASDKYEFESGTITDKGENVTEVITISGADGGKAVDLRDAGDKVSLKVNASEGGNFTLTIRYSQPYDENGKYQNVYVNGENIGQIICGYTAKNQFKTVSISANLRKGSNIVEVEGSWGWSILDSLTVEAGNSQTAVSGKLSNPNATAETQSLYSFLCDTYGKNILSGQQESTWMGSEDYEFNIIKNASGKLPVIRGLDYMGDDFSGCNRRAKSWHSKGGIVTICWHCGSDFTGSHTESMETNLNWDKALTEGTAEYNNLIAGMDKGAKALLELQKAGVPVIWRPFHETDGGWFWWSKGGAENFKKLWRIMYDRYTNHWGLNNLIWICGYSGDVKDGWYPGDEYVDVVGADTYVDHTGSLANMYSKAAAVADKPVCLHENGPVPDPDKLVADGSKWLWFMTWHTSFIDSHAINTSNYINKVYNSDYVLTLDELPDVYHYSSKAPETPIVPSATMNANPVISRNVPAYSGKGTASNGNDNAYWNTWDSSPSDYLAYDLSGVPAENRKKVIAVWYNTSTYDNVGQYVSRGSEPIDYVIEVNSAKGGSYPNDGWKTVKTVSGNGLSSRQALIDMAGYNWIRIRVTKALDNKISLNFDIHDASNGVSDSWIFFGDSITAGSMVNSYGTSFAVQVNSIDSRYYPVQENGGIGGTSSYQGKDKIDGWLSDSSAKYVSIAYGTNDSWGNQTGTTRYYESTKYMIDAVLKAGKVPVLPTIPYSTNKDVNSYLDGYNAMVEKLYNEYGDKLVHGPDFNAFFRSNPNLLGEDGVHPSFDGYEAMRKLWAETMYANVYSKEQAQPEVSFEKGDINGDGMVNSADAVLLQRYILGAEKLSSEMFKRALLTDDDAVNSLDMVVMRKLLTSKSNEENTSEFYALYEAESASISGKNTVSADNSASGGKAVGSFSDDSDKVTFNIEVPENGSYQLIFTSKGLGGEKENNISIDNVPSGTFKSQSGEYGKSTLRRVVLTKGKHTVTVSKSWGWIQLDSLEVKNDEAIKNSVYEVSNKLIDKNANSETKALFNYLCESYGKVTLSGQVCNDALNGDEFKSIYEVTGKYPAICGFDMMDYTPSRTALGAKSNAVETAIEFHKKNGISTFCWHWNAPTEYLKSGNDANGNPRWWQGFNTANTNFDIDAVMNGKDSKGKALIDADIKEIAYQLKRLENAGVSVLWRPLHEASGGWFWWGAKGPDAYKKLWKYLYTQLTDTYGCHNLIWVWNGQNPDWYPGDEWVDIIGEDIYAGERVYSAQNGKFSELLEYSNSNKIIALTENGTIPDIDNIMAANSKWAWFGTWCGDFVTSGGHYSETFTEKSVLKKVYQSEYVITLDELPKFS